MDKTNGVRTLIFDIETMANLSWVWGKYEQNVIDYDAEWYMLSYSYKWLGEKSTHVLSLPDFKGYKSGRDCEKKLIQALWKLFDEADIIVAHNGASFDIKKSNAKFIEHGLQPPSPYKVLDTKLIARKYFKFNSNKLDDLAKILGLGRKMDTGGFELWLGCHNGDMKAWKKMCAYNKHDVVLLEKVYMKLRGWIAPLRSPIRDGRCPQPDCGSKSIQYRGREKRANGLEIQRVQCQCCGRWGYLPAPKVIKTVKSK